MLAALGVAACADRPDRTDSTKESTTPPSSEPTVTAGVTLLTWSGAGASYEALLSGELRVSSAGCLSLGKNVLVAPPASQLTTDVSDELILSIPGLGDYRIGDRVEGPGGYVPSADLDVVGTSGCDPEKSGDDFAVLSQPG
jgi:hypothetical protein